MLVPIYHRTECDECHENEEGKLNNESKLRCWIMTSIVKSCEQRVNIQHSTLNIRTQDSEMEQAVCSFLQVKV